MRKKTLSGRALQVLPWLDYLLNEGTAKMFGQRNQNYFFFFILWVAEDMSKMCQISAFQCFHPSSSWRYVWEGSPRCPVKGRRSQCQGRVVRLPSGPHRSLTQAAGHSCSLTALLTGDPVPWGWTILPCWPGPLFPVICAADSHEYAGRCWVPHQPCTRNNILSLTWGSRKGS